AATPAHWRTPPRAARPPVCGTPLPPPPAPPAGRGTVVNMRLADRERGRRAVGPRGRPAAGRIAAEKSGQALIAAGAADGRVGGNRGRRDVELRAGCKLRVEVNPTSVCIGAQGL